MIKNIIDKIEKYIEYKKNLRITKREFAKLTATTLPAMREFGEKSADILNFIRKFVDSTKEIKGENLINLILSVTADKLATNETRLIEILQYIVNLSPEDIQKILVHSMIETMNTDK